MIIHFPKLFVRVWIICSFFGDYMQFEFHLIIEVYDVPTQTNKETTYIYNILRNNEYHNAATKKSGVNLKAKHTTNQDLIIFIKYLTYIKSKSVRVNIIKFYNVAKESL